MKHKRLIAGFLSLLFLVSTTLPVFSSGSSNGVYNVGGGGTLSSGNHLAIKAARGFSIGITTPTSYMKPYVYNEIKDVRYASLDQNWLEKEMAYTIDQCYRTNYPVAEESLYFYYTGNNETSDTVYLNGAEYKGKVMVKLNTFSTNATPENYLDKNVIGEAIMYQLANGNSWPFDNLWEWYAACKTNLSFNSTSAQSILKDVFENGISSATALNQFIGEMYASKNKNDIVEVTTNTYGTITGLSAQEVRKAAYLGLLLTIYEAGTSYQKEVWKTMITDYCYPGTIVSNDPKSDMPLNQFEWASCPTLVVVNSLGSVNTTKPIWMNLPSWYGLYKNTGTGRIINSETDYDTIYNAGNSLSAKNLTQALVSYWIKINNSPKSSGFNNNVQRETFSYWLNATGKWEGTDGWGVFETIKSSRYVNSDWERQLGAGVFFAPHYDTTPSKVSASGSNILSVTPEETNTIKIDIIHMVHKK